MNRFFRLIAPFLLLAFAAPLCAAPGAHGPNGEHLDGPAAGAMASTDGRPRMEGFSEIFELVAHLEGDAVVAMINDYASNAPVDGAEVELESGALKASATFDPVTGQYRFADPKLIEALSVPGKHPMAFTIAAGDEFDIVGGSLEVADDLHHAPAAARAWPWWLAAAVVIVLLALFLLRRRGARTAGARP